MDVRQFSEHDLPEDLEPVAARLRKERPQLSALELDDLQRRIHGRVRSRQKIHSRRQSLMKSRMAITFMLVLGLVFSTAGAGLAVDAVSDNGSAGIAQYPKDADVTETLDETATTPTETADEAGEPSRGEDQAAPEQAPRQVAASTDEDSLPFTGFAAIPVLLIGLALLISGVVLRRRVDRPVGN